MNLSGRPIVMEYFRAEKSTDVWYGHISSIFSII